MKKLLKIKEEIKIFSEIQKSRSKADAQPNSYYELSVLADKLIEVIDEMVDVEEVAPLTRPRIGKIV